MNSGAADQHAEHPVELTGGWPGWVLRLVVLAAGAGAVLAQADGLFSGVIVAVLLVIVLVSVLLPATPAPAILIASIAVAVTVTGGDPLRASVLVELPLLHLVHVGAALAALVPIRAVIAPRALFRPLRRFLVVQAAVFAVVGLAELLPTGRNATIVELAGLLAVTGLVILAIRLIGRGP